MKYTGIEFGEASLVPRTPAEVFERRYGDCKDKALLLTALLRAAGIPAEVALLDAGFGADVDPDVPGFGSFDHAIVYLPGPKPLWIDATDRFSPVGDLPLPDQGRLALVAARGTKSLLRTPVAPASANLTREDRSITVGEDGKVRVVETSELWGSSAHAMRADYSRVEKKEIEERLAGYVRSTYRAKTLGRWQTSDFYDVGRPLRIELATEDAGIGSISDDKVSVVLPVAELFERLPEFLRSPDERAPQARQRLGVAHGRLRLRRRAGARAPLQDRRAARLRRRSGAGRRGDVAGARRATRPGTGSSATAR